MKKRFGKRKSIILRIAIIAACVVFTFQLVKYNIEIAQSKQQLEELNEQLMQQQLANEELERYIQSDTDDDYYEKLIRENLEYGYPNEKVFIEATAN